MSFFIRNLIKPILGLFLFGLAVWFSPIEASAYQTFGVTQYIPNGTSLPYQYFTFFPSELGTTTPTSFVNLAGYSDIPFEFPYLPEVTGTYEFDLNVSLSFCNSFYNVKCDGPLLLE